MNDSHGAPIEARLAVLEDNMRRVDARLGVVSDRTHTLISSINAVTLGQEDAHGQRAVMLGKIDDIQHTIGTLTTDAIRATSEIGHHVSDCIKRGARLEKIQLAVLVAILTLAATLLAPLFVHH